MPLALLLHCKHSAGVAAGCSPRRWRDIVCVVLCRAWPGNHHQQAMTAWLSKSWQQCRPQTGSLQFPRILATLNTCKHLHGFCMCSPIISTLYRRPNPSHHPNPKRTAVPSTSTNLHPPFHYVPMSFQKMIISLPIQVTSVPVSHSHPHSFLPTGLALPVTRPAHPNQAPVAVLAAHQGSTPLSRAQDSLAVPPPRAWASLRSFWRRWAGGRGRV